MAHAEAIARALAAEAQVRWEEGDEVTWMPNGKRGDHPFTDIVLHNARVYSDRADDLVRRIARLGGGDQVASMLITDFNEYKNPDVPRLERLLSEIYDRLVQDARARGWEVDD